MDQYLIAFGSNLGEREHWIRQAIALIEELIGNILKVSQVYETAPIGPADQSFLNGALVCQSRITSPFAVLEGLLSIEKRLGRIRDTFWGNRTIDLDLIAWKTGDGKFPLIETENLSLPHPRCIERDFVMVPVCEIASEWYFARSQQCFSAYLEKTQIKSIQKKWGSLGSPYNEQNTEKD
ncbi:MAG: 2-amino-4-hydroxy-6-hydroxymethyldihydropteridine diphosphokinase [Oligoflexus sp.]